MQRHALDVAAVAPAPPANVVAAGAAAVVAVVGAAADDVAVVDAAAAAVDVAVVREHVMTQTEKAAQTFGAGEAAAQRNYTDDVVAVGLAPNGGTI